MSNSLTGDAFSSLLLDNDSPTPTTFGYSSSAGLLFSSALGLGIPGNIFTPTLDLLLWQVAPTLAGDDGDGAGSHNGGADEQSFGNQAANQSIVLDVSAFTADLATSGGGIFDIDCGSTVSQNFLGGGGNIEAAQVTTASCSASIEYDFTPAPVQQVSEPHVLAALALGLIGFAFPRRVSGNARDGVSGREHPTRARHSTAVAERSPPLTKVLAPVEMKHAPQASGQP